MGTSFSREGWASFTKLLMRFGEKELDVSKYKTTPNFWSTTWVAENRHTYIICIGKISLH
jgi:hypothetical protein